MISFQFALRLSSGSLVRSSPLCSTAGDASRALRFKSSDLRWTCVPFFLIGSFYCPPHTGQEAYAWDFPTTARETGLDHLLSDSDVSLNAISGFSP
jgi:hypothetical protein